MFGSAACPRTTQDGCEFWDPTAVFDAASGDLMLLAAHSTTSQGRMSGEMTLWISRSSDAGATWAAPQNITSQVTSAVAGLITPGNGHAIQTASGTLIVAGYLRPKGDTNEGCATIRSDDSGRHWRLQLANMSAGLGTSECEVSEITPSRDYNLPGEMRAPPPGGAAAAAPILLMDERMNPAQQKQRGGCGGGVPTCRWRSTSTDGGLTWVGAPRSRFT